MDFRSAISKRFGDASDGRISRDGRSRSPRDLLACESEISNINMCHVVWPALRRSGARPPRGRNETALQDQAMLVSFKHARRLALRATLPLQLVGCGQRFFIY